MQAARPRRGAPPKGEASARERILVTRQVYKQRRSIAIPESARF
jgi:hypothetical protein